MARRKSTPSGRTTVGDTVLDIRDYVPSDTTADCSSGIATALGLANVIVFPPRPYVLNGSAIDVQNKVLRGVGSTDIVTPFDTYGSVIKPRHTSNSPFRIGQNVRIEGLSFWWDQQPTSGALTAYPPLFVKMPAATHWNRFDFNNNLIVNAYTGFQTGSTDVAGDWRIRDNRMCALNALYYLTNGMPEILRSEANFISPGCYDSQYADWNNQIATAATVFDIDIAHSSSTNNLGSTGEYGRLDGFKSINDFIFGYTRGFFLEDGLVNVSQFTGTQFDGVQRGIEVTGDGALISTLMSDLQFWAFQWGDADKSEDAFAIRVLSSSAELLDVLEINNISVHKSTTHGVYVDADYQGVMMSGGKINDFGDHQTPSAAHYGVYIDCQGGGASVSGLVLRGASSTPTGLLIPSSGLDSIALTGNTLLQGAAVGFDIRGATAKNHAGNTGTVTTS